jgi:hypothetical protein
LTTTDIPSLEEDILVMLDYSPAET